MERRDCADICRLRYKMNTRQMKIKTYEKIISSIKDGILIMSHSKKKDTIKYTTTIQSAIKINQID